MTVRLDTASAPASRRLSLWRDIVCDVFVELDCRSETENFHGSVTQTKMGALALTRVQAAAQRVFRTPSRVARAKAEYLLFAFGATGVGGVIQDGRETLIRSGEFAFYDTTRPYQLSFDADFSQTILQIPRALAQQRLGALDNLTATTFARDQPLRRLAADFVGGLSQAVELVGEAVCDRLASQALDLIAMAIDEPASGTAGRVTTHRAGLLYRLKREIESRLRDPDLSLSDVAAALRISPRYVNLLLEAEHNSFGRHLLVRRLEQCRRDLGDPAQGHRQIAEIAYGWGFNELSHFSRAFRAKFGAAPREFRAAARGAGRNRRDA